MGLKARPKPERLAEKLLQIRLSLGLSQDGMLARLELDTTHFRSAISGYELGREPPLPVLLKYARCVGVSTDVLIDDEINLPGSITKAAKSEALRRTTEPRTKRRR
mgnify:CR=1 FL=1